MTKQQKAWVVGILGYFPDDPNDKESIRKIAERLDPNIKPDSEVMEKVCELPLILLGKVKGLAAIHRITNPSGQRGSSKLMADFWLKHGWAESEAKARIIEDQRRRSVRCIEHWISKGYSERESLQKVSEIQSKNGVRANVVKKELGVFCAFDYRFWMQRGMSEAESKEKTHQISMKGCKTWLESTTKEERKKHLVWCKEYWEDKGGIPAMERFIRSYKGTGRVSKSATRFFDVLVSTFPFEKQPYYGEYEFGKYIPDVGYRFYDFVETKMKVVIEYDSKYWHRDKTNDAIKQKFMEGLGFTVLRVSFEDCQNNQENELNRIVEILYEIKRNQENREASSL